ncbi:MAG: SGNH/GDSL hydrolase family protein [Phycisphaerae bacterium]
MSRRDLIKLASAAAAAIIAKLTLGQSLAASTSPAATSFPQSPPVISLDPATQPSEQGMLLRIGRGTLRPDLEAGVLFLTVKDVKGFYTLPYIQSSRDLEISADFAGSGLAGLARIVATLSGPKGSLGAKTLTPAAPAVRFAGLEGGEYDLTAVAFDSAGKEMGKKVYRRIGVGAVIAALGDSLTEGYFSAAFMKPEGANLSAWDFPAEAGSRDRRNFPQYAPTTHIHLPSVNTFASWMPRLNDLLSLAWGQPVFIANEGWGGITTGQYLELMKSDLNWQQRMRQLAPTLWLIHLGVNDERAKVSPEDFGRNLAAIVDILVKDYHAAPADIFIARPSFDYWPGAKECLTAYCGRVEQLIAARGLSKGPNFFEAFSHDRDYWYGQDPAHPKADRMAFMGDMWYEVLAKAGKVPTSSTSQ